MAKEIKIRRGTAAEIAAFTGVEGEVSYSTDDKRLIVHDGVTAGGELLAKKSEVLALPYVAKTGTYVILDSDYTIDCTANTFTVTLPTAVGISGRLYVVKNSGVGVITVDADGAETIDGLSDFSLVSGESVSVQSNGANWIVI